MDKNSKRPKWYEDPESGKFKLFNQPLEEAYGSIKLSLKKETRQPENFYFYLNGLLETSFQTYKAILKLVAKDPKYTFQAHLLGSYYEETKEYYNLRYNRLLKEL